jgi:hypothetical protein
LAVNKVTWQRAGHVNEPGRYMFRFGWLTVTADDLAIWTRFPDASFALVKTAAGRQRMKRRSFILAPSTCAKTPGRGWTPRQC